jgi:penicillin-binding protein 1A
LILLGLGVLALVSAVFGMLMSVASDLPQLENTQQYAQGRTSYLYDDHWRPIGIFAPPNHEVIDTWKQFSPWMIDAIIAREDKRFWSDPGIDLRGVVRAIFNDITGGATQGGSTIAEQFVKNTLHEDNNRTILEKLREAALAFQLTHKWTKVKILTEYLNSIYFGNGAYGVESAARVYFGRILGYDPNAPAKSRCGDSVRGVQIPSCASQLQPAQAALLAGMVANPAAFDPTQHPEAAKERRNLVLQDMLQQGYLTRAQYEIAVAKPIVGEADLQLPQEPAAAPYFTSWLRPQILRAMGLGRGVPANVAEYRAYYGGLKIKTTLDLRMQQAADQAIAQELPYHPGGPVASLVAIDNATGEVRAMVGGPIVNGQEDYQQYPFNLATEGERQPGSAFKPFTLAVALESGYTPSSVFLSAPALYIVPNSGGKEVFSVHNFGDTYSGPITLQEATDVSDNSVFSRLGILGLAHDGGTRRIAATAGKMGIRTPVSSNYAMILGGLTIGVSPLDMAHAYETFATLGRKVYDPVLGDVDQGPTGMAEIQCARECPRRDIVSHPVSKRVLPLPVAQTERDMLEGPVQAGTATAAAIPGVVVAGKTGTTTNYGDAWFVGWTPQITVAVWVGYPNGNKSMSTLFNGGPVEGGTYPALIWHNFVLQALQILASEYPHMSIYSSSVSSAVTPAAVSPSSSSSLSSPSSASSSTGSVSSAGTTTTTTSAPPATTNTATAATTTSTPTVTQPSGAGGGPSPGTGPAGGGGPGSGNGTGSGNSGSGNGSGSGSGNKSGGSGLGGGGAIAP